MKVWKGSSDLIAAYVNDDYSGLSETDEQIIRDFVAANGHIQLAPEFGDSSDCICEITLKYANRCAHFTCHPAVAAKQFIIAFTRDEIDAFLNSLYYLQEYSEADTKDLIAKFEDGGVLIDTYGWEWQRLTLSSPDPEVSMHTGDAQDEVEMFMSEMADHFWREAIDTYPGDESAEDYEESLRKWLKTKITE